MKFRNNSPVSLLITACVNLRKKNCRNGTLMVSCKIVGIQESKEAVYSTVAALILLKEDVYTDLEHINSIHLHEILLVKSIYDKTNPALPNIPFKENHIMPYESIVQGAKMVLKTIADPPLEIGTVILGIPKIKAIEGKRVAGKGYVYIISLSQNNLPNTIGNDNPLWNLKGKVTQDRLRIERIEYSETLTTQPALEDNVFLVCSISKEDTSLMIEL